MRNITRRMEVEAQIRSLNAELEQRVRDRTAQTEVLNREWEACSYSVSHDLRAPLRWIGGFAKALDEDYGGALDVAGQQFIHKIRTSAEHMSLLLDALTEVARFSRTELRRESVDLSAMARRVAVELQLSAPGRKVELVIAEGITTSGDPRLLKRVLENLLGNAYKFTATVRLAKSNSAPRRETTAA